jgi:protein-S-isoprenylcysteine O-methyltransferase Ste14
MRSMTDMPMPSAPRSTNVSDAASETVGVHAAEVSSAVSATRPKSAVSSGVGVAGMVGLVGWFFMARHYGMDGPNSALASVFFCGLLMVGWSVFVDKVHRNPSTGIDWSMRRQWAEVNDITPTKIAGLWATWAIIGAIYCIMRYYWQGNYAFAMTMFGYALVPLLVLSIPYCLWLDRRLLEPRDGAWHFGRWLVGGSDFDQAMIWKHARAWAVKGFFTAFMVSIVPGNFQNIVLRSTDIILSNPLEFALFGVAFFYLIDVHFATVGYVLTMRPLDAHIRTANPYGMAWVAALVCYPPFALMNPGGPFFYGEGTAGNAAGVGIDHGWSIWAAYYGLPTWSMYAWAGIMILLTAIYAWATVAFGLRFSNLTHRGIITHGPYAWTRHPAYVSKNAFWWMSGLVILPWDGSMVTAIRNTALLASISGIYYWRAKTEERHLLADPDYQAYWNWAQEHAAIPRLCRWFTGLARPMITLKPDDRVGPVT